MNICGLGEFTVTGLLKNYDRIARLKEITIPTLFTCGRYDEAAPVTTTYYHSDFPDQRSLFSRMLHMNIILGDLNTMCEWSAVSFIVQKAV
jgi:proline iminopeptidase